VIHNVFDTDHSNPAINMTSSYLDLAPLYGGGAPCVFEGGHSLRLPVREMRAFDGRGRIWDDCFADARLLSMPPAVAAILVLLNRNHNVSVDYFVCEDSEGH
jgi:linoleate 10R-lipoxygenase